MQAQEIDTGDALSGPVLATVAEDDRLDILLVVSPTNARSPHMPFYYLYLAGYMEERGYKVRIADPKSKSMQENLDHIYQQIRETRPRFVGLAAFVTDFGVMCDLAKSIKKISDAVVVVGNAHPSTNPEDFIHPGSDFDIAVRGEGEETLEDILELYKSPEDLNKIKGIAFLEDGKMISTPVRKFLEGEKWGRPAYHMLDMAFYARPSKYLIRTLYASCAIIYTARGCPFKCGFCAANAVWDANEQKGTPIVRNRPMDVVMEELRVLQDVYHFDFFYILDDTFGLRERDVKAFCEAYKKSGLKMLWAAETRVACIKNKEILEILIDAGCIQLDFGVETGAPHLLDTINKKISVAQIKNAFTLCHETGMRSFANMLINLPGETEEDLDLTEDLLDEIRPTYTSIGVTQPYPGTPFYSLAGFDIPKEDYGLLDREVPPENLRMAQHGLNLRKKLFEWQFKYGVYSAFPHSTYWPNWRFWKQIFRSKRKMQYLRYHIKTGITSFIIYLIRRKEYFVIARNPEKTVIRKRASWQLSHGKAPEQ